MAPVKKLSKVGKRIYKKRMLGTLIVISFVAFGATVVTYYLSKAKADLVRAALVALFIGGLVSVFIEMRGVLSRKISRKISRRKTESRKVRSKKRKK